MIQSFHYGKQLYVTQRLDMTSHTKFLWNILSNFIATTEIKSYILQNNNVARMCKGTEKV